LRDGGLILAGLRDFSDAELDILLSIAVQEKASADAGLRKAQARAEDARRVLQRLMRETTARRN
jgi:hypothetical protein